MTPIETLTQTSGAFTNVWLLFTALTVIGITAHAYITTRMLLGVTAYTIRYFTLAFGSFGMVSMPVLKTLEAYITTPYGYVVMYGAALVIFGVYLFITGVKLLPSDNAQTRTESGSVTIEK
jgi:hypothetical protein